MSFGLESDYLSLNQQILPGWGRAVCTQHGVGLVQMCTSCPGLQLLSAVTTGHPEDICNPVLGLRMDPLPLGCCPTAAVLCPAGDAEHCLQRWLCFGMQGWVYLKDSLFLPCPLWCVSVGDDANGHPDTSGHNVFRGAAGSLAEQSRLHGRGMRGAARDLNHQ